MGPSPRRTLARLLAAVVVLAAACGDQRLSTPTSPSMPTGTPARVESDSDAPTIGVQSSALLASVSINPSVFKGGESTRATVTLTGPAPDGGLTVALSSDETAATLPSSLTIAAGATSGTFTITTRVVTADVRIRITVTASDGSLTALMRLTPQNSIASLSVTPFPIRGGTESGTGTVTLSSPAPAGGALVTLESSNIDAQVPASVTIAANGTSGTFTIETRDVSNDTEIWITASVGRDSRSTQIRLVPRRGGGGGGGFSLGGKID